MKNTKKVLSVALAGALAFGSMGAAFAAAPVMDEKTDAKIKEAINRLYAFGIVNGMEDGKYHEEMKVTREQFAKIIVEAMGLGDAAGAAKGATKFGDVEADRWSSGYVNVAVGQGLLKGYPDGTFKPAAEVSYAESVTMLVRALGYKDEFLSGNWPGNYVAKAADAKITAGAAFNDPMGKADRGTVALLVDNTLDAKVVKVDTYEGGSTKYVESKETLLKSKLDISKYENTRVLADKTVDDGLNKDEVLVKFLKDMDDEQKLNAKNNYKEGDTKEIRTLDGVNLKGVLGEEATIYVNKNDKLVYAESENDDKSNYDYVDEITKGSDGSVEEMNLVKFDKELPFAEDAEIYMFNASDQKYTSTTVDKKGETVKEKMLGKYGKFVVKNNEIVYARIDDSAEVTPWMYVKENKSGEITGIIAESKDETINIGKDTSYDGVMVFDAAGNKLEVSDIKEGNILLVQKQTYDGDDYAMVTVVKDTVKGKMDKVKDDRISLDSKEYKVSKYVDKDGTHYQSYYSVDKDKSKAWYDNKDWDKDMEDADDAEMVAHIDPAGRVMFLTSDVKQKSSDLYGIVTRVYRDSDKVKVYTQGEDGKGDEVTYNVEETKDLDKIKKVGDVIKFSLNKKGEIAEDELEVGSTIYTVNGDLGKNSIKTKEGKSISVDSDAVIINAKGFDPKKDYGTYMDTDLTDDFGTVKWDDISEDDANGDQFYAFLDKDLTADAVIFFGENGLKAANDSEAIYVIDKWKKNGDDYIKYADSDGKVQEKQVNKVHSSIKSFVDEEPYVAKVNSNGEIDIYLASPDDKDLVVAHKKVASRDGSLIKFEGDSKEYKLPSNAVVYDEDSKKTTSNIRKGDIVGVVIEDGVNVRIVEINDDCGSYSDKTVAVDSVKLDKTTASVKVGDKVTLTATVSPSDASNKTVTWKSSDESVATVKDGVVTAVAEGKATITVTTESGAKTATCSVTVTKDAPPVGDIPKAIDFTVESGIAVGTKLVTLKLDTTSPELYNVKIGDVTLKYNSTTKLFGAIVPEDDAKESKVVVTKK